MTRPLFRPRTLAGETVQALDFDHPWVVEQVTTDMDDGVAVYYDRHWGLTERFCVFLHEHPELFRGRNVYVAGAGAGLEAVALGRLAGRLTVNDHAPASLTLASRQLDENGVTDYALIAGSFADADLSDIDVVVACFVVYDESTRDAVLALLDVADHADVPAILANEDVGSFFREVLDRAPRPVTELARFERGSVVRVE